MSYILDALRRADNERERTAVPGLHTRPLRDVPDDEPHRRGGPPWTLLAIVALALALLAALAWILWPREAANEAAAAPPPTPVAAVAAPPVPPPPPPVPMPAPAAPAPVAAAVTPPPAAPAPRAAPAVRQAEAPAPKKAAPDTAARAATPASAAAPEPRPPALKDLPEDLRRQIPALTIGGSIYSESAASRFVIINGQLFHENDTLAPELTLRQIRLKSAILEFRGQRFEIGY